MLPITLEGIGRITHLINMDTIIDLVDVLKSLLGNNVLLANGNRSVVLAVKLSCIHCAYNTLLSPGGEFNGFA